MISVKLFINHLCQIILFQKVTLKLGKSVFMGRGYHELYIKCVGCVSINEVSFGPTYPGMF